MRDRILDAALAILGESGLRQFTQPQIAERAGVRQSHLTYYFPTRQELLEAVAARAVEGISRGVAGAVQRARGADDAQMIARLARAVADVAHMRMFLGLVLEADGDPGVRALLVAETRRLETALADAIGGDDALERARLVLTAVWGLGLYEFLVRPPAKSSPTPPYVAWVADLAAGASTAGRRAPSGRGGSRP